MKRERILVLLKLANGEEKWVDSEYKDWEEVKASGWEFEYVTSANTAMMKRGGYLNEFKMGFIEDEG